MGDEVYIRLREYLDTFPLGFPATEEGVELEILKTLFTPGEAELFLAVSPLPEKAENIAARAGLDPEEAESMLYTMSKKGLLYRVRRGDSLYYNAAPFMIGLYEYSVKRLDGRLARLYRRYYDLAYAREMAASGVPGFKVLPLDEVVTGVDRVLYPYCYLCEQVRAARVIAVAECICRKEAKLLGEGCDAPAESCLMFGAAAEYYIENGLGRRIDAGEALAILEEADRAGLVHAGVNAKHLSNICNCCPCCCASLKGITKKGMDKRGFMNSLFVAEVDDDSCTACGSCLDRCPVGAVSVEQVAIVDGGKCLGCGLCATSCPAGAVKVSLREDRLEPFNHVVDLGLAILRAKAEQGS
jgi:NAD-dependent dihydropyrimidine dehydrogenase PreA subunit